MFPLEQAKNWHGKKKKYIKLSAHRAVHSKADSGINPENTLFFYVISSLICKKKKKLSANSFAAILHTRTTVALG